MAELNEKGIHIPYKYLSMIFGFVMIVGGIVYNVKDNSNNIEICHDRLNKYIERFNEYKKENDKNYNNIENRVIILETNK